MTMGKASAALGYFVLKRRGSRGVERMERLLGWMGDGEPAEQRELLERWVRGLRRQPEVTGQDLKLMAVLRPFLRGEAA